MPTPPNPPRSGSPADARRYILWFWLLLAAGTAFKVAVILRGRLDLSFDEAYYWGWARELDWCYFSKGPGIAASIWFGTLLGGDTVFGVRLAAVLCSVATAAIAFFWARGFFGDTRRAFLMVLMVGAAPMFAAGGMLSTIDAPFFLCWTAGTAALWRAVRTDELWAWAATGLAVAAGLQCKFTMGFFLIGVVLFAALSDRRLFVRPGLWLSVLIAAASLTPILIWNSRHGWITFRHTADKAGMDAAQWTPWLYIPQTVAEQLGGISPVLWGGVVIALWHLTRDVLGVGGYRPDGAAPPPGAPPHDPLDHRRAAFLLAGAAPIFLFYFGLSFRRGIPGNWVVAGYLTAFAAAAWYWARPWDRLQRISFRWAIGIGLAMQLPLAAGDLLYDAGAWDVLANVGVKPKFDLTNRLRGWKELGEETAARFAAAKLDQPGKPAFFLAEHYKYAAWFDFYGDRVHGGYVFPSDPPRNQYDIRRLAGRAPAPGANALYLREVAAGDPADGPDGEATRLFERTEEDPDPIVAKRGGVEVRRFFLTRCYGFKGF